MSPNYTAAIQHWGFKCPKGSKFYICENTWAEFIGCCKSNPCADGSGLCPGGLKALSFDPDKYADIPTQICLPSYYYYTCAFTEPPFFGCCGVNACAQGCPDEDLSPTLLSQNEQNRNNLLYPPSLNLTPPLSSKTPLQPVSTLLASSFKIPEYDVRSSRNLSLMKPEAVAGICSAILIATLVCLGVIVKYW